LPSARHYLSVTWMNLEGHGMAVTQLAPVLHHIRRLAYSGNPGGPGDGQLLEQYILDGSEEAFAVLVRRHGPMVLGVCRRVLKTVQDAEDAFQATFLLLVRNAPRIVNRESVGSWLHGVAYRTSLKARTAALRRRMVEQRAIVSTTAEDQPDMIWRELRPLLDEAIDRLPEQYRLPVVLCYLEGKTNTEAARLLRWPKGTVATRLARARQQLRNRLTQRGVALSAGGLGVAMVPASLRASVVQAAVRVAGGKTVLTGVVSEQALSLAKGVLRTMWITKMRLMAAVLVGIGTLGGGTGLLLQRAYSTTEAVACQDANDAETRSINSRDTENKQELRAYQLRNTGAADVSKSVNTFLAEHEPDFKGKATVLPEPVTNKLFISAPRQHVATILRLVKELDAERPQIVVQAIVMEVGADGQKDILSRPQMATPDNQTAHVFVGQSLPVVQANLIDPETIAPATVKAVPIGVALDVTPRIGPDGKVRMRVQVTISKPEYTNAVMADGKWDLNINKFELEKTIEAADGETVTISGSKPRGQEQITENKVPLLGDLPILGRLFRYRQTSKEDCEVRVLLTPHVVRYKSEADQKLTGEGKKTDGIVEPKSATPPK
jgi:RNA polymerase sigma factor (sigma-70 family)